MTKTPTPKKAAKKGAKRAPVKTANKSATEPRRDHLWKPGQSGNPNGRPAVVKEVRDLARANTATAFQTLLDVCTDTEAPPAARVAAAAHILDRGYGKPTQTINQTVRTVKQMTDDELIAYLADEADSGEGIAAPENDPGLPH